MTDRKVILPPEEAYNLGRSKGLAELSKFNVSANFTWGEVFVRTTEADFMLATLTIYKNAAKQAVTMELVRKTFGNKPITVINWYRSLRHHIEVYKQVAKQKKQTFDPKKVPMGSYHLMALATDFTIAGYGGVSGNKTVQKTLDKHPGFQMHGLEFTKGSWTHVDTRGYKERFYA